VRWACASTRIGEKAVTEGGIKRGRGSLILIKGRWLQKRENKRIFWRRLKKINRKGEKKRKTLVPENHREVGGQPFEQKRVGNRGNLSFHEQIGSGFGSRKRGKLSFLFRPPAYACGSSCRGSL